MAKLDSLRPDANRYIHTDHLPVNVHQRPARVARVDAGIGLNQVVVHLGVGDLNRAVQSTNDSARHRVFVSVGVPNGDHLFAFHQVAGRSDPDHRQRILQRDPNHRQVGRRVVRYQAADHRLATGQRHVDLPNSFHYVVIRQDVAAWVDDHAGTHSLDAPRAVGWIVGGGGANRFLSLDVDHRGAQAATALTIAEFRNGEADNLPPHRPITRHVSNNGTRR